MSESRRALLLASLAPFALFVLLGVAVGHGWLGAAELDRPSAAMRAWAADRSWLEGPLLDVERVFGTHGLTVATVALAALLLLFRQVRASILVVLVMVATRDLTHYAKAVVGRDRPEWQDADLLLRSGSYPSAHAATVAAFGGLVILLTIRATRSPAVRSFVVAAVCSVVILVCADRLLLGRHYPTDLVGGVLLATGLVLLGAALVLPRADVERGATLTDDAPSKAQKPELVSRSA